MNKKQTAVEWLVSQLPPIQQEGLRDIIEQANVMFERQIIDAFNSGDYIASVKERLDYDESEHSFVNGEQYFTETYGELKT